MPQTAVQHFACDWNQLYWMSVAPVGVETLLMMPLPAHPEPSGGAAAMAVAHSAPILPRSTSQMFVFISSPDK